MSRAFYRISQFFTGLRARIDEAEIAHAARILPPGGTTLFLTLPPDVQRHSLNVLRTLERHGDVPDDLAIAALLHDTGKLAARGQISLWTRGPLVLLEAIAPAFAMRLARLNPPRGWRYALWVQQNHAAIGAQWARELGCTERACALIARHQDRLPPRAANESETETMLRRLQAADNAN